MPDEAERTIAGPSSVEEDAEGSEDVEEIGDTFDTIVFDGQAQLNRPWTDQFATGMIAGIDVAFGVLALIYVEKVTGSIPLGGLAFSIGFIALLLGQSGLFTEGFFVPVMAVISGRVHWSRLVGYWFLSVVSNLSGGAIVAFLIVQGFPSLRQQAIKSARYYVESGINVRSFCLAVLAGAAITLLTRMQVAGTTSDVAKLVANVASAFLLAGVRLFHSILDSLLAFVALDTGHAPFGYLSWFIWFLFIVAGNMLGGLGLTTFLRAVRSRERILEHRSHEDGEETSGRVASVRERFLARRRPVA